MGTSRPDYLEDYFKSGIKKEPDLRIGVEWEKLGVYEESAQAIRYSGPRGVEAIFRALTDRFGWTPVFQESHVIALAKKNASITLEPGGQIELSGRKCRFLKDNAAELYTHLDELKEVSRPLGIAWLGLGLQPVSLLRDIEWVPKERYRVMRQSLKKKGRLTHAMMKQTASIQVSLDYLSEEDAIQKLRLALALKPFFTAFFANSPISEGRFNGFYSKRSFIWSCTAPERTGVVPGIFSKNFGFKDYVDYVLSVPLLFIVRKGRWIPVRKHSFDTFLKKGYKGFKATEEDWTLHLSTIFTEARLKTYLEIRSMDCQKKEWGLSAPALLKGLFYDSVSQKNAWRLVRRMTLKKWFRLSRQAAVKGLKTPFEGRTFLEAARDLFGFAEEGLKRLVKKGMALENEREYLKPLKDLILNQKITPAEHLLRCWGKAKTKKERIKTIIRCAAI